MKPDVHHLMPPLAHLGFGQALVNRTKRHIIINGGRKELVIWGLENQSHPGAHLAQGLLVYPQVAGIEHFEPQGRSRGLATGTDGYMARVGRWLKDSF